MRGWDEEISGFSYGKAEVNDIPRLHHVIFSLEGKNQGQRELPGYLISRTLAVPCRQSGQQLLGGQKRVREARPVDLEGRVHAFLVEGSGRILNEGDVVAKLHAKARRPGAVSSSTDP